MLSIWELLQAISTCRLKETTYLFCYSLQGHRKWLSWRTQRVGNPYFSADRNALHHIDPSHVWSSHLAFQPMLSFGRVYELIGLHETYNVFQLWAFYFDDIRIMQGMGEESRKDRVEQKTGNH